MAASVEVAEARSPPGRELDSDEFDQPMWLDTAVFSAANFDADAFIAAIRPHVPLEAARAQLREHLAALHAQLVELINRDYNDFVNLSTKLVDVDGAILRMRVPLSELRQQVAAVRAQVAEAPAALGAGLQRRADAAKAREALELLLDTANVLSKVEKLLAELEALPPAEGPAQAEGGRGEGGAGEAGARADSRGEGDGAAGRAEESGEDSRSRLLERIASEMSRLRFFMARGRDLPFVRSIEARVSAADASLSSHLSTCLAAGLLRRQPRAASLCLRAFASLERTEAAEEVFRSAVIAPLVTAALTDAAAQAQAAGGEEGPAAEGVAQGDLLEPVFLLVQARVDEACRFVLEVVKAAESSHSSFHFIPASVLRQVLAALQASHAAAFSPGRPQQFLANYNAAMAFLGFLEGYYTTVEGIASFRSHPAYQDFSRAWNLPAYYASRFREIAGLLDEALAAPATPLPSSAPPSDSAAAGAAPPAASSPPPPSAPVPLPRAPPSSGLALLSSLRLWEALQRCWHPAVFVPRIADKFLRLTLQLVARFHGWVAAGLAARKAGSSSDSQGGAWGIAATAEDLSCVWHDLAVLSANIAAAYADAVEQQLRPAVPSAACAAVRRELAASASSLQALTEQVAALLADIVAERCAEGLRPVRAIAAMYRVPTRPMPTRHSHYVATVLQPFRALLDGGVQDLAELRPGLPQAVWSAEMRAALAQLVAERITAKYDEMAREVVATARRTESSLKLLQQRSMRKPGSEAQPSTVTDTEKITAQLFLDAQEFGRQLRLFSVDPLTLEAFKSLWAGVCPADQADIVL